MNSEERLHVLLLGPPLTGKSSLAAHLEHGKRKILSLDRVIPGASGAFLSSLDQRVGFAHKT